MLGHLRVLDLTDGGSSVAGRMLSDIGADVVLVEPPEGAASRRLGPFADDRPGDDRSLEFWSRHRGKRSIRIDLEDASARERLREWVTRTDVWVDDAPVGRFADVGLGYEDLRAIRPELVHASITPFGELGPKSDWAATDLTVTAASTAMALTGDADRAPLTCSIPQAFLHGGAEAAAAVMVALAERHRSGRGQHIDVSAQTAMMASCQSNVLSHGWNDRSLSRCGGGVAVGEYRLRFIYECLDGFINLTFLFGEPIGHATARFFDWMDEEGYSNDTLRSEDWVRYGAKVLTGQSTVEAHEAVMAAIERFTRTKTKAELYAGAFERKVLIVPLSDTRDLLESKQLAEREYWTPIKHASIDREILYPGPFARFSATPIRPATAAPALAEPEATTFRDLTPADATPLDSAPLNSAPLDSAADAVDRDSLAGRTERERAPALAGLRVLDFTWVYAGPAATRVLADYGATVIKIESGSAPDALRASGPFKDQQGGPERSANYGNVNLGKHSLGLNMKTPEARELVLKLVDWADVVLENFSPRAMKSWGLDYETLREHKPELVMLSTSLAGATGPESSLAGYGTMGSALAGFGFLTGWPDRRPAAPYVAYTDYVSPRFSVTALLGALEARRRTGKGQHIDVSQAECSMHFLGSAILDYTANAHIQTARGNEARDHAPCGVYPTQGEDRWIAIEAARDSEWHALAALADEGWERDARFRDSTSRWSHRAELDAALASWTSGQGVEELEARLQEARVPAHRVSTPRDAFEDPQLAARSHFVRVEHTGLGEMPYENSRARLSETPGRPGPCPTLGQHNTWVLDDVLGLSDDEMTELVIAGAIE